MHTITSFPYVHCKKDKHSWHVLHSGLTAQVGTKKNNMQISSTVYYYYGVYLHVPSKKELHKISVIPYLNKANIKQGVDFTKGRSSSTSPIKLSTNSSTTVIWLSRASVCSVFCFNSRTEIHSPRSTVILVDPSSNSILFLPLNLRD